MLVILPLALSLLGYPGPTHYVLVFAHQDTSAHQRPSLRSVHSFATWVRVENQVVEEAFTISWTGRGTELWRPPHAGRNLSLAETIAEARQKGYHVSMWGPYRVTPQAFQSARRQFERLVDGERTMRVRYAMLDHLAWPMGGTPSFHCVHALTDIAGERIRTGALCGVRASEFIVQEYSERGLILGFESEAEWIWEAIRPADAVVSRRGESRPTSPSLDAKPTSPKDSDGLASVGAVVRATITKVEAAPRHAKIPHQHGSSFVRMPPAADR